MKPLASIFALGLALTLVACSQPERQRTVFIVKPGGAITGVNITALGSKTTLASEASITLGATVEGKGEFESGVIWRIVSGKGRLSADAGDTVTFTATGMAPGEDSIVEARSVADPTVHEQVGLRVPNKPTVQFEATPNELPVQGGPVKLQWKVSADGETHVRIGSGPDMVPVGQSIINLSSTTSFDLTATNESGSTTATVTVKVNKLEDALWVLQVGEPNSFGNTSRIHVDSEGGIVFSGYLGHQNNLTGAFLARSTATGTLLWKWTGNAGTTQGISSLDANDNIILAGASQDLMVPTDNQIYDLVLTKYTPTGIELWRRRYPTSGSEEAAGLVTTPTGEIIVSGTAFPDAPGLAVGVFVAQFDKDGLERWRRTLSSPTAMYNRDLARDANGNIFVLSQVHQASGTPNEPADVILTKLAPDGKELWNRKLGTPQDDLGQAIAVGADGRVFVTGSTKGDLAGSNAGPGGEADAFLVAFDTNGQELWKKQFGVPRSDSAYDVFVDANQRVLVVGTATGEATPPTTYAFVVTFNPSGTQLGRRNILEAPTAFAVTVNPIGQVILGGSTPNSLGAIRLGVNDAFIMQLK